MRTFVWLAITAVFLAGAASAADIPQRPEKITFPSLTYEVPDAASFAVKLANGVPAYVAEDRLLPLISVQVYLRGGRYLEGEGKEGLASLTGTVWRSGGAGELDAKTLDEELDFLAAQLATSVGSTTGSVGLNLLAKDLDRGLALLVDVIRSPRFQADRLAKAKEEMLAEMKRRNDETGDIESREWNRLLYGEDYWLNRLATKTSVDGITRDDLVAFHKRLVNPANLVVAVAGDFDKAEMIGKLNATIGALADAPAPVPPVPQPTTSAAPGVYVVDKPDVNQGRVSIGHMATMRPLADEFAATVANDVFGGHGFTAWMMKRVRSDEGLAYSAYADFGIGDQYPGTFRAYFQTKSSTCNRAAHLTVDLMKKLIAEGGSDEELTTSKNSFIETFPRTFESKLRTVSRYAMDDLVGRSHDYWKSYRDNVRGVDGKAAQAAAAKHIWPDKLVVLVVGNIEEILKGHPDFPDVKLETLGKIVRLPLRDPLTQEPLQ